MTNVRLADLPGPAQDALARGETISVVDDDRVVAVLRPERGVKGDWDQFFARRAAAKALDHDDFKADIDRARERLNTAADYRRWE
jgi:hypothetical protein